MIISLNLLDQDWLTLPADLSFSDQTAKADKVSFTELNALQSKKVFDFGYQFTFLDSVNDPMIEVMGIIGDALL